MPARFATSDTVAGLSPDMTFMATPCSLKYVNVLSAFSLIGLERTMYPIGLTIPARLDTISAAPFTPGARWPDLSVSAAFSVSAIALLPDCSAIRRTLYPLLWYSSISSDISSYLSFIINSGAPSI